jgi:hypothetical protein
MQATMARRPQTSPVRNLVFGQLLERLTAGFSSRDLYALTGISHTTIANMVWGVVPSYATLREFADRLQQPDSPIRLADTDRAALFRAAGFVDKSLEAHGGEGEEYDARTYWHGLMSALRISFGAEAVRVSLCGGEPDPDTPPDVLDRRYERIRGVLLAEQDINRVKS